MPEPLILCGVGIASFSSVVTVGTFAWCTIQLHCQWNKQYFIKRNRNLVVMNLCCWLIYGITLNFFFDLIERLAIDTSFKENLVYFDVCYYVLSTSVWFGIQIHCIRIWLLYFNLQISQILKNRNWQAIINPDIFKNNWYLNPINQRRFGYGNSSKNLIIVAGIISIIMSITHIALYFLGKAQLMKNGAFIFAAIYALTGLILFGSAVKLFVLLLLFRFFFNFLIDNLTIITANIYNDNMEKNW